jgi:hypothetical protein
MSKKKREKVKKRFMGPLIDARNRIVYLERYREDFKKKIANSGNPDKLNVHEIDVLATGYANVEIKREKKHLKAFIRGHKFYKFYGRQYPVLTPEVFEQQRKLNFKAEIKEEE